MTVVVNRDGTLSFQDNSMDKPATGTWRLDGTTLTVNINGAFDQLTYEGVAAGASSIHITHPGSSDVTVDEAADGSVTFRQQVTAGTKTTCRKQGAG